VNPQRWFWYSAIAVADGAAAAYVGAVAFALPGVITLISPLEALRATGRLPSGSKEVLVIASFLAAALWAPCLVRFLERRMASARREFVAVSAAAGVVYGLLGAWTAPVLVVPLAVWVDGASREPSGIPAVIRTLHSMLTLMFSVRMALSLIALSPVILVGGSLVGVLNGLVVRGLRFRGNVRTSWGG